MPSYLVTGGGGQLSQCFHAVAEEFPNHQMIFANRKTVDITLPETLQKFYNIHPFEGIINCAGFTKVDKAEAEPGKAHQINAKGVLNLSEFALEKKLSFVHFSTDHVFDGTHSIPYKEYDKPNPINSYGQSKFEGEMLLKKVKGNHTTFRISWLFSPFGHNFVKTILKLSNANKKIQVVKDQWGCPTYGIDLARMILTYIDKPHFFDYNCYHYTHQRPTTRYDFAYKIISLKKSPCIVIPCYTSEYPTQAKRPRYTVLDTTRIENHLSLRPLTWEVALKDCLNRIQAL